jgi:hypothetical protein
MWIILNNRLVNNIIGFLVMRNAWSNDKDIRITKLRLSVEI